MEGLHWTITHDVKLQLKWEAADVWMIFKYCSYALKKKKNLKIISLFLISLSVKEFYFLDLRYLLISCSLASWGIGLDDHQCAVEGKFSSFDIQLPRFQPQLCHLLAA